MIYALRRKQKETNLKPIKEENNLTVYFLIESSNCNFVKGVSCFSWNNEEWTRKSSVEGIVVPLVMFLVVRDGVLVDEIIDEVIDEEAPRSLNYSRTSCPLLSQPQYLALYSSSLVLRGNAEGRRTKNYTHRYP